MLSQEQEQELVLALLHAELLLLLTMHSLCQAAALQSAL